MKQTQQTVQRILSLCLPILMLCVSLPAQAQDNDASPKALVEKAIMDARSLIRDNKDTLPRDELEKKLKSVIFPVFDFREMSRRSLGKHWNDGTKEQQKEYVDLFSELLGENYLDTVIDGIEDCTINFEKERIRGNKAIVRTAIIKTDKVKVDYRLRLKKGEWHVYDVIIENIGLVSNYRNEFAGIIRKEKFAGLILQIKEKVQKRREERAKDS